VVRVGGEIPRPGVIEGRKINQKGAGIKMSHEVETMVYNSQNGLPWHGLGEAFDGVMDSETALVRSGLMWSVALEEMVLAKDGQRFELGYCIVRQSDRKQLGMVGKRYSPVQNAEAFRWTDGLIGEGATYETAGSLKGGRRVWLLAHLPEDIKIAGDDTKAYVVFSNSHDGSTAVKVAVTPIRVVCQNTLTWGMRAAKRVWSTPHVGRIHDRMNEARRALGLTRQYMAALKEEGEKLATVKMAFDKAVALLVPHVKDDGDQAKRNKDLLRQDLALRYKADDLSNFQGTAWGFLQSVADHVAHSEPVRETKTWHERRWEKIIDGDKLLQEAREIAVSAAN
jgi:phage/plasmid-like protein (TIGR03299 family)